MSLERVGIVGYGRFGRALAELATDCGFCVRALDARAEVPIAIRATSVEDLSAAADILVLAVPVPKMALVLGELAPHLGRGHLVLDVGSVKSVPTEVMARILGDRVPWVGTHPLFGPTSLALGERPLRVVVCPNELVREAPARARAFFERLGCEVIEQAPEAHDRAMADTHALTFFIAKGFLDARAGEGVASTPPSFQAIARTIEAVRSDAGHLFFAIQRHNPYAGQARRRLLDALSSIDEQIRNARDEIEEDASLFSIPDLGAAAPDLQEARELIDGLDRELIDLLARRAELARRAGRAKAEKGKSVRDVDRERVVLAARAEWGEARGLDPDAVRDVFDAILRLSREVQRTRGG